MDVSVKDISLLLMMSEKDVLGLVKRKEIPFQSVYDKIAFNKQQIVEWALTRNIPINVSNVKNMEEYQVKTLGSVLDRSAFFYDCGFSKETYIEQMVDLVDFGINVDKEVIVQLLKNREEMMSTAVGHGISLPHPRIPLMVGRDKPLLAFFFLKNPIDLDALDGKPVHTIVLLISQTIKQHLSLLAHLSFLLLNDELRHALENRLDYGELLGIISRIESERRA